MSDQPADEIVFADPETGRLERDRLTSDAPMELGAHMACRLRIESAAADFEAEVLRDEDDHIVIRRVGDSTLDIEVDGTPLGEQARLPVGAAVTAGPFRLYAVADADITDMMRLAADVERAVGKSPMFPTDAVTSVIKENELRPELQLLVLLDEADIEDEDGRLVSRRAALYDVAMRLRPEDPLAVLLDAKLNQTQGWRTYTPQEIRILVAGCVVLIAASMGLQFGLPDFWKAHEELLGGILAFVAATGYAWVLGRKCATAMEVVGVFSAIALGGLSYAALVYSNSPIWSYLCPLMFLNLIPIGLAMSRDLGGD